MMMSLTGRPLHVCSFHDQLVLLFTSMSEKEGLQPDYDSYSAVIKSYLKEAVCGYRQFSPSHPASRARGEDGESLARQGVDTLFSSMVATCCQCFTADVAFSWQVHEGSCMTRGRFRQMKQRMRTPSTSSYPLYPSAGRQSAQQLAAGRPATITGPAFTLTVLLLNMLTCRLRSRCTSVDSRCVCSRLQCRMVCVPPYFRFVCTPTRQSSLHWRAVASMQGRVNLECWTRVTELYEITVSKGMTLSPGLHYNMMRTAILMANAGHVDALHFAKQCLDDMHHLGARQT